MEPLHRRRALQLIAGAALLPHTSPGQAQDGPSIASPGGQKRTQLSPQDDAFLDDMQRRGCLFFREQASPHTGQVLDRAVAANPTGKLDLRRMASIAATGFGLTALCIADERRYQPRAQILEQVRRTLRYHCNILPHDHGFFSHFNDLESGYPYVGSEISSIDTSLLLCGALTARAHFHADAEIVKLATTLYERVDWPWMLNGGQTFSMGLRRDSFLASRWNHYCELMMIYLLALGSPTHPVDAAAWESWTRPKITYDGLTYIGSADPLFVHQYSHAWFDFRGKRDKYANYFENSILATRAHKAFCLSLGQPYSADYWGVSASDSEHGYTAWGGPPMLGKVDGSVVPCAAAGSLPFLPGACLQVLRSLKAQYGKQAWGRYGFCDAFHPEANWYDPDVLGIDLGIGVLMAENLRTGFVWETFARNPEVAVAMQRAGFHSA